MIQFLNNLLGTYTPVSYNVDGVTYIADGMAGVDWPYCVRAIVFIIVLYAVFRILGGMLCRM